MYPAFSPNPASRNNGGRIRSLLTGMDLSVGPWSPKLPGGLWTSGNLDRFAGTDVSGDRTDSSLGSASCRPAAP
jgi:hypothetical protein